MRVEVLYISLDNSVDSPSRGALAHVKPNTILLWRNIIDYLTVQLAGRKINRIKNATEGALRLRTFHCNLASVVTLRYFQLTLYVTVIIRPDLNRIVKFSVNLPYASSLLCTIPYIT